MSSMPHLKQGFASAGKSSFVSALSVALFALFLLAEGAYCFERPISSFDTLAYVSIIEGNGVRGFADAGQSCQAQVPGEHSLCSETAATAMYQSVQQYSDRDYATFLRFYEVKPLYTLLLRGLHRGFHWAPYLSLRIVSTGSFLMTGAVLIIWLRQHLSAPVASFAALCLMSSPSVLGLGRNLLPDALSTWLVLLAAYLLLNRSGMWPGIAVLAVTPLARPDNILLVVIFGGLFIYRRSGSTYEGLKRLSLFSVACVLLNAVLLSLTHALSWPIIFTRSFIAWIDPASFAGVHVTVAQYVHVMASNGVRTVLFCLPVSLFLAALALSGRLAGRRPGEALRDLLVASAVVVLLRVLLFPGVEERYYVWFYLVCAISAAAAVGESSGNDRMRLFATQEVRVTP